MRSSRTVAAVVLAAGKGKRMRSAVPKVLHDVCGRPGLWHVIRAARAARPTTIAVVVGNERQQVEEAVRSWNIEPEPVFVDQGRPLGTGHALMVSERAVAGSDDVLLLAGDDPLVTADQVRELMRVHRRKRASATLLTTRLEDPTGYGRVFRDGDVLLDIVEEFDATPEIRTMNEVATLVYAFRRDDVFDALPALGRSNRQGEYYLHKVLPILRERGKVTAAVPGDFGGALGLNTRDGLAKVTGIMRGRIIEAHLRAGVTFIDPETSFIDVDVRIGRDTVVQPLTFLQGTTRIGSGCSVGPATRVVDSTIGDGADVTFSVVRESRIGRRATVGPYASIRPGTVLAEGAKAGTFVEIKDSRVGRGSKVPHLSYVGDTTIGRDTNIGAGTVTVNYDGFEKHRTVIGDEVHIGSDNMLVAPIRIGRRAWTAAGSVISKDVPAGALAVERTEQRIVRGYDRRKRSRSGKAKQGEGGG